MRHLGSIWKGIKLIGSARDLALETRRFQWTVTLPNTFFVQAEHCDINLSWHDRLLVVAELELQASFGWQWTTDQDDAGVYVVARRKPLIGSVGRGRFSFTLPHGIHVSSRLENCRLCCHGLHTSLELPPFDRDAV